MAGVQLLHADQVPVTVQQGVVIVVDVALVEVEIVVVAKDAVETMHSVDGGGSGGVTGCGPQTFVPFTIIGV